VQQLRGELDPVLPAQRVERLQRLRPEVLGAPGVECDGRVRLDLEPPDHVEHALIRAMGGEDGLGLPALFVVPGQDPLAGARRQPPPPQEAADLVLVHIDVVGPESAEMGGAVRAVVGHEQVADHVPHVEDGPVDVEHDEQVVVRVFDPHGGVVPGQTAHPIGHVSAQGTDRR
jgi:hypothetical protein